MNSNLEALMYPLKTSHEFASNWHGGGKTICYDEETFLPFELNLKMPAFDMGRRGYSKEFVATKLLT